MRLHFFGGKGGVGKTTCAAAQALALARGRHRVLIVSTDPAHSLGDAFGLRLSSRPVNLLPGRRRTVFGVELDAAGAIRRWLARHRHGLGEAIEHGSWLDRQDVDALLDLPLPGVDELLALQEVLRIGTAGRYTHVIVDTAPTGHTLRLLSAPDTVAAVADVLDIMQASNRIVRQQFAGSIAPDAADRFIRLLAQEADATRQLLRNPARTAFHWVLLPEALSLAESRDGIAALSAAGIAVPELIANRVMPPGAPCPLCDRRRAVERRMLARIARALGRERTVTIVPALLNEPRGIAALTRLGSMMRPFNRAATPVSAPPARLGLTRDRGPEGPSLLTVVEELALILIGGKGGVGKSTVAAAAALALAGRHPEADVLLLSTDPAHSLGDVLATDADDTPRAIRGGPRNLVMRELDAPRALALRKAEITSGLEALLGAIGSAALDDHRLGELMDLAPPGIDELFGVLSVVDAHQHYRHIVVDTAPTGHTLRLLEMPDAARQWVQLLLRVLLKYRAVVPPGKLAAELVALSQSVRRLQDLLQDPGQTGVVIVTRAAELPRRETVRMMGRLRRLGIASPAVIVNARTMIPGSCPRCRRIDRDERRELTALARAGRRQCDCVIIQAPLVLPPPSGVAALRRWAATWM